MSAELYMKTCVEAQGVW